MAEDFFFGHCHGFCNRSDFQEVALKLPSCVADVPVAAVV
jgi:hypothetical protein